MTTEKNNSPVATHIAPALVDTDTLDQLVDLARRAEDMHGVQLVSAIAVLITGRYSDRPWAGFCALVDAVMIRDSLAHGGLDPAVVTEHSDRDAAIREWEVRIEDSLRLVLGLPASALSTAGGA